MTIMFPTVTAPGTIPPRPVTNHRADTCTVAFDSYGTVSITGPRKAELAGMVSALPLVLRALANVTAMLRDRDGAVSPYVAELEAALLEAGINSDLPTEEAQPMSIVTPTATVDCFAMLLGVVADKLDAILADRKALHSTPTPIRDALADISTTIRRSLRETPADPQVLTDADGSSSTCR